MIYVNSHEILEIPMNSKQIPIQIPHLSALSPVSRDKLGNLDRIVERYDQRVRAPCRRHAMARGRPSMKQRSSYGKIRDYHD